MRPCQTGGALEVEIPLRRCLPHLFCPPLGGRQFKCLAAMFRDDLLRYGAEECRDYEHHGFGSLSTATVVLSQGDPISFQQTEKILEVSWRMTRRSLRRLLSGLP
jgi:hypothetical protein